MYGFWSGLDRPIPGGGGREKIFSLASQYDGAMVSSAAAQGFIATTGVQAADFLCNADSNKPDASAYKALLVGVDSSDSPLRRASTSSNVGDGQVDWVLTANTKYLRVDGTEIASTGSSALFTFPLQNSFAVISGRYWTGLKSDWTTNTLSFCDYLNSGSWTDATSGVTTGAYGFLNDTSNQAIGAATTLACNITNLLYLLCVEQ